MNPIKGLAIVLIALGVAGLAYGGFSYTKDTQKAELGPFSLTVKDQRTVNVPVWVGVAAVVIGAGLLLAPQKR